VELEEGRREERSSEEIVSFESSRSEVKDLVLPSFGRLQKTAQLSSGF